jgi:hypothetical protein
MVTGLLAIRCGARLASTTCPDNDHVFSAGAHAQFAATHGYAGDGIESQLDLDDR